jgi:hypothetical protein
MAILLSDVTQSIDLGNILQPTANMTVCCWFYATDLSTWKMIFGREDSSGSQPGWHLEINTSRKGDFHSDHGPIMVDTTTTIELNTWYHMLGVRDTVAGNQRIYLNGVLEGTGSYGAIETVVNQMQIGQTLGWPGEGFLGILDDLRFYDRVLTDSEIQTIYSCRGSDSITYGLQARWLFIGPENKKMGDISTISVSNLQNTSSDSSGSSITLDYTAPVGSNLVLVVSATAEDNLTGRVLATNVTFNGNALTNIASVRTTTSLYNGISLWRKSITSGESGNIVATWSGNNNARTLCVCVLVNAQNVVEVSTTSYNNSGTTTADLTTVTDGAVVVSACVNKDGNNMTAVGTGHILDSTVTASSQQAGAIGHVDVATAGTISGIGFTASPTPSGEALILAAFTPVITGEQITELSNNEFVGTAINLPKYQSTFLKFRRSLYNR